MAPKSLIQWNARSVRPKKHSIISLINEYDPVIFAISESWLVPKTRFTIPNYVCLRNDRADGYAGAALIIKRCIPFSQIPIPNHSEDINAVAAKVFDFTVLSIYISKPCSSLIPDLYYIFSSLPGPILILGDFNAHHTSWGSHKSDLFAVSLLELFDDLNLCILNNGSPTHIVLPNQNPKSVVDLSLSSPSLSLSCNWSTLPDSHGSDHFPILLSFDHNIPEAQYVPSLKFHLSKANWSNYSYSLENKINLFPPISFNNVLLVYSQFESSILSSANANIPQKKPSHYKPSTPWWDQECTDIVRQRSDAEKVYISSMTPENFLNFKKISANAKKTLNSKKRSGWLNFCESLSPKTPPSLVWKQIKRFRKSYSPISLTSNNTSLWLDEFINKLAPTTVPASDLFPSSPSFLPPTNNLDSPFSMDELLCALDGLKDSSPGIDEIPYSFLVQSTEKTKVLFLDLVNYFLSTGFIPPSWKTQIVIPILKPNKNPSDPNSYRPIALSSTLCKITEILLKNRLEWFVENNNILAKSQFGFRKGFSTLDSIAVLTTDIQISFKKKQFLAGVFLDIEGAYDNVILPILRQKLHQLSIPERLTRFICNLLMCRSIQVRVDGSLSSPRSIWKGLPQGSVLSPLLYSLYTYDLESSVNSFCNILQYADDIALYCSSSSISEIECNLNSALYYLHEWLHPHGLSLSVSKSSCVIFTRKRLVPPLNLFYNNDPFPFHDNVKFLGVYLDSRMTGLVHSNYIAKKCEKGVNVLRALSGVSWGAHPFSQKLLYNAVVRSHFDYASFLLEPCNKAGNQVWDRIQSKCLRIILGAMRSTAINALQIESGDPPLHFRKQYLCDRFIWKLFQNSSHPLLARLQILHGLVDNNSAFPLLKSYSFILALPYTLYKSPSNPIFCSPFESLLFRPNIEFFKISKQSPDANHKFNSILAENWNGWTPIFTDASKTSDIENVGIAVWMPKFAIMLCRKCPPVTSTFVGEALALLEAVLYVLSHKLTKSIIFTDSKSCLQALTSNQFRSKVKYPVIIKLKEVLLECKVNDIDVTLAWIPGHSGITGNESADLCAKAAINISSETHELTYSHDIVALARPRLFESWKDFWSMSSRSKGKFYRSIQNDIPPKPWFFKYKDIPKGVTSTICRIRLGHASTPVHLAKIRVRDNSICECGIDEADLDHIFFNCTKNSSLYDNLPPTVPRPTNMQSLLSLISTRFVYVISKFIISNKIKL
ncbi:unnamed protein product [Colias eurytheme]|nr:unnamed protein product [Colias eurytheme]